MGVRPSLHSTSSVHYRPSRGRRSIQGNPGRVYRPLTINQQAPLSMASKYGLGNVRQRGGLGFTAVEYEAKYQTWKAGWPSNLAGYGNIAPTISDFRNLWLASDPTTRAQIQGTFQPYMEPWLDFYLGQPKNWYGDPPPPSTPLPPSPWDANARMWLGTVYSELIALAQSMGILYQSGGDWWWFDWSGTPWDVSPIISGGTGPGGTGADSLVTGWTVAPAAKEAKPLKFNLGSDLFAWFSTLVPDSGRAGMDRALRGGARNRKGLGRLGPQATGSKPLTSVQTNVLYQIATETSTIPRPLTALKNALIQLGNWYAVNSGSATLTQQMVAQKAQKIDQVKSTWYKYGTWIYLSGVRAMTKIIEDPSGLVSSTTTQYQQALQAMTAQVYNPSRGGTLTGILPKPTEPGTVVTVSYAEGIKDIYGVDPSQNYPWSLVGGAGWKANTYPNLITKLNMNVSNGFNSRPSTAQDYYFTLGASPGGPGDLEHLMYFFYVQGWEQIAKLLAFNIDLTEREGKFAEVVREFIPRAAEMRSYTGGWQDESARLILNSLDGAVMDIVSWAVNKVGLSSRTLDWEGEKTRILDLYAQLKGLQGTPIPTWFLLSQVAFTFNPSVSGEVTVANTVAALTNWWNKAMVIIPQGYSVYWVNFGTQYFLFLLQGGMPSVGEPLVLDGQGYTTKDTSQWGIYSSSLGPVTGAQIVSSFEDLLALIGQASSRMEYAGGTLRYIPPPADILPPTDTTPQTEEIPQTGETPSTDLVPYESGYQEVFPVTRPRTKFEKALNWGGAALIVLLISKFGVGVVQTIKEPRY